MTDQRSSNKLLSYLCVLMLATSLGGCMYDYSQHTDRVSQNAGEAIKANMAMTTTDPSSSSMNDTTGLGENGRVVPEAESAEE